MIKKPILVITILFVILFARVTQAGLNLSLDQPFEGFASNEKEIRGYCLEGRYVTHVFVLAHEIVQVGGSTAWVADDKDRRLVNHDRLDLTSLPQAFIHSERERKKAGG